MTEYIFKKIDAFATEMSSGNPAGYISLEKLSDISEKGMQQIARELKGFVNEVGFVAQIGAKEFDLKYYSSEREVDFCGHATIAIMYDIIKTNINFQNIDKLVINTNRGKLSVDNLVKLEDSVFIMSPEPVETENILSTDLIAKKLKLDKTQIDGNLPISIINAGLTTLIVPISDLKSILSITPHQEELKEFCIDSHIDIIEIFTSDVYDKPNNFRTRVFAPTFGYLEDPATGSGNSVLGYYLLKNNMWKNDIIHIEQNGKMENFNSVKLRKQIDENGNTRVCFGGGAITRIEGKYYLHNTEEETK